MSKQLPLLRKDSRKVIAEKEIPELHSSAWACFTTTKQFADPLAFTDLE